MRSLPLQVRAVAGLPDGAVATGAQDNAVRIYSAGGAPGPAQHLSRGCSAATVAKTLPLPCVLSGTAVAPAGYLPPSRPRRCLCLWFLAPPWAKTAHCPCVICYHRGEGTALRPACYLRPSWLRPCLSLLPDCTVFSATISAKTLRFRRGLPDCTVLAGHEQVRGVGGVTGAPFALLFALPSWISCCLCPVCSCVFHPHFHRHD